MSGDQSRDPEYQKGIANSMRRQAAKLLEDALSLDPDVLCVDPVDPQFELGVLRKRVAELEVVRDYHIRAAEQLREERYRLARTISNLHAGMPVAWRALTDRQRYELSHDCCHGCGSLDTGCQCWNDE